MGFGLQSLSRVTKCELKSRSAKLNSPQFIDKISVKKLNIEGEKLVAETAHRFQGG